MTEAQKVTAPAAGQGTGDTYTPFAYYWSSTAVSFEALMELLKSSEEAYRDMAACSIKSVTMQGDVIGKAADATYAMYEADAISTRWQMGEQIGSCATSGLSFAGTLGAAWGTGLKEEQTKLNNLELVERQTKGIPGDEYATRFGNAGQGPQQEAAAVTQFRRNAFGGDSIFPEREANGAPINPRAVMEHEKKPVMVKGGRFFTDHGIDETIGNNETIGSILETAHPDDVSAFKRTLSAEIRSQAERLNKAQGSLSTNTQLISMATQGMNAGVGAGCKSVEADQAGNKAAASRTQAIAQGGQEFMRETNQAQKDQYGQYTQQSTQVFKTLNELVQVDTRG